MTTDYPTGIPTMDAIIDHCSKLTAIENQRCLERLDKLRQAAMARSAVQP